VSDEQQSRLALLEFERLILVAKVKALTDAVEARLGTDAERTAFRKEVSQALKRAIYEIGGHAQDMNHPSLAAFLKQTLDEMPDA
jgi:hypothetical protein